MKVGDLVYDDEMGKHAVIVEVVNTEPTLYKLLMDDGERGYAYRSDIVLVSKDKIGQKMTYPTPA